MIYVNNLKTNKYLPSFILQLSENMYRKRPSPNGLIPTLPESIVGWQISTLILGMANSLLNFWKSSLVKDWYVFPVCLFSKLFDYIIVVSHCGRLPTNLLYTNSLLRENAFRPVAEYVNLLELNRNIII